MHNKQKKVHYTKEKLFLKFLEYKKKDKKDKKMKKIMLLLGFIGLTIFSQMNSIPSISIIFPNCPRPDDQYTFCYNHRPTELYSGIQIQNVKDYITPVCKDGKFTCNYKLNCSRQAMASMCPDTITIDLANQ